METVYPDDNEIKFRKANFGVIENILNDKVECTICCNDLMNEIVSKKMIMVHRIHLVLCCYNCFYKLCDGDEFCCILCESNNELFNCEKCNFNVCKRCIEIHKIDKVSNGVLTKCFGCQPRILWKQRAQTSNVLKIFSSQLEMPNGLLVNDIKREQNVRKYLIKEAKNGQNSKLDIIKNKVCLNFLLNLYKSTVIEKINAFSPNNDDSTSIDEHLNEFIQICEKVIEKTCSTLTSVKRVFNISSQLNTSVSAVMKSLLKPIDEDENVTGNSKMSKIVKKNKTNQSLNNSNSRSLRSEKKQNVGKNILNSPMPSSSANMQPSTNQVNKDIKVVIERLDDSILLKKMSNKSSDTNIDVEKDAITHPLDLFDDNSSSNEEENTRKLRSRKIIKIDEKKQKIQSEKPTKNKKIVKSDDEKENDRLTNFNNMEKRSNKTIIIDEKCFDIDDNIDTNITTVNKSNDCTISPKLSKNEIMEKMNETVINIDDTDSGSDDNLQNEEYSLNSVKDILSEVGNAINIPLNYQINNETCISDESDDSSITDIVNMCSTTCNGRGIEHYIKKNQGNQLKDNDLETIDVPDEIENQENTDTSDSSVYSINTPIMTRSKQLPHFKLSSTSDESESDSLSVKKMNGSKRKLSTSTSVSNNSDSSSKYFKKSQKKKSKNMNGTKCTVDSIFTSNSSNSSSDEESLSISIKKRGRIKKLPDDSSDKNSDSSDHSSKSSINTPIKKGRKNIRKLKKKTELSQLTLNALEEEVSRKMRIKKRQQLYNQIYDLPKPMESCKKLVLDFDPETKKEIVVVHPDLVKFLKPHQVEGVKFLWNSVFESLAEVKNHKGSGSIIAHCMGLGKTLQVVTLVHTLFRYPEMGIKTVLIITPHSTIENWCSEFHKWLNDIPEERNFRVLNLTESKSYESRKKMIEDWQKEPGVLIASYQMYRTIVNFKSVDKYPTILEGLVDPGPDVVICDEGHLLKNQSSATSKTINRIKTLRRIVLTGTPLQNNLKEYHCMVDFIRPNLLGSIKDFGNRFISPITNGQYSDSTPYDVKLMKKRSHVLHRMLEGFVQRFDYSVLTPFLPPKYEYVIYLKLSDKQIELYQKYLESYRQPELFSNYHILQMIWTHPKLLQLYSDRIELKREKQKLKELDANLINDETSNSDSNSVEETENDQITAQVIEYTKVKSPEFDIDWWKPFVSKKDLESVYPYSKFLMMFSILKGCEEIGDKVLIFSQSLFTLDLIQEFLENSEDLADDLGGPYGKSWIQGQDFFRIDGSVSLKDRENCCNKFNDVTNIKMRLLLLSTKAFNLGINLVGANRVVIFDVTWNPSLNVQSIFRVFRFGQTKPCYIYRLVSEGSMEQKIYERQISKLSLAFRVIDERQIDRHFNNKEQEILYEFEPSSHPKSTLNLPKDRLMAELILKHKDLVIDILEHDSLLQNNQEEELDEDDRNAAWDDYQKEKEGGVRWTQPGVTNPMNNSNQPGVTNNLNLNSALSHLNGPTDETLFRTLKEIFPQANLIQLNEMMLQVKTGGTADIEQ